MLLFFPRYGIRGPIEASDSRYHYRDILGPWLHARVVAGVLHQGLVDTAASNYRPSGSPACHDTVSSISVCVCVCVCVCVWDGV